jgi:hypothetical protein
MGSEAVKQDGSSRSTNSHVLSRLRDELKTTSSFLPQTVVVYLFLEIKQNSPTAREGRVFIIGYRLRVESYLRNE